jgi:hypothetical protein
MSMLENERNAVETHGINGTIGLQYYRDWHCVQMYLLSDVGNRAANSNRLLHVWSHGEHLPNDLIQCKDTAARQMP